MCGIVGAVSQRNIVPILIEGLRRLEYRGYDSCGVAEHAEGGLKRARSVARVAELDSQAQSLAAYTGIAHTRWATHGAPSTANAHPHFSTGPTPMRGGHEKSARTARIALVHNGIIENYEELRTRLKAAGYVFESLTDTEVVAHMIDSHYEGDLFEAVQRAVRELRGCLRQSARAAGRAALRGGGRARWLAGGGAGQQRELPRVRRDGAGRHHRPDHLPRGR